MKTAIQNPKQHPVMANLSLRNAAFLRQRSDKLSPLPDKSGVPPVGSAFDLRPSTLGFTLIELLIVIAIMAILAAMVIPISGAVNRNKIKAKARGELEQVATAIDLYKAKLGHYPPDNPGFPVPNQLFFELSGTTFTTATGTYDTLDGSARVRTAALPSFFANVGGFVNTTQGTAGDEGRTASSFLSGLKPDETITITNPAPNLVKFLVVAVPAPANWTNFIAYVSSSPTNNPNSYDLWVDISLSGKTYRFNNWSKEPQVIP